MRLFNIFDKIQDYSSTLNGHFDINNNNFVLDLRLYIAE